MGAVITWEQLFIWLAVILGVYYGFIILVFYQSELQGVLRGKLVNLPQHVSSKEEKTNSEQDATLYNNVLELMQDCKQVFQAAVHQQLAKEQILEALRIRLRQYSQIKGTAFQISITSHIVQEMDHRLNMILTDEEAELIWL